MSWLIGLTAPLFQIPAFWFLEKPHPVSGRDLILLSGGLFLLWKSTHEIHDKLEGDEGHVSAKVTPRFANVVFQILLLDIVFSLDSVITAVGMVNEVPIMVAGVVIAMIVMVAFADPVSNFINEHASLKILALAFLLMIGTLLTGEAVGFEVPKGVVYSSMFFSLGVQLIQMRYEANLKRREEARSLEKRPAKKDRTEKGPKRVQ